MPLDGEWRAQAGRLCALLQDRWGGDLVAVHLHGSAALGGWIPASDLDVLVVVRDAAEQDWGRAGSALLDIGPAALELSVVRAEVARRAEALGPFVLHVAHRPARRVVLGTDAEGDPDLLMHFVVARAAGITLLGPEPSEIYGRSSSEDVRCYLASELDWALDHADERYAVLNACRAAVFARDGEIVSKVEGGRRALERADLVGLDGIAELVGRCLEAQRRGTDLGAPGEASAEVVAAVRRLLLG